MTIYGMLCGLKDYVNIADLMKLKEEYFTQLLDLENETPSHDRLYYLLEFFSSIDLKKFIENISKIKDKEKWKTVNAIAYTKVLITCNDETNTTENYYIIDYQISIEKLIETIRDHWNIECGLHWKLDVILDEDHSRNRIKNSIDNLSIMKKIIFNLASLYNTFGKVPLQIKLTRYMLNFKNIEKHIFEIIPSIS